jgi:acetyl-CoA C-acetyltransferase
MFLCCVATLLKRNSLVYDDIQFWEIHEAFAAQVLSHIKAMESPEFLRDKAGVIGSFGAFPRDRMNPNGGSVALGHPFGATGARILSHGQAIAGHAVGSARHRQHCADGGQGTVALLQSQ